MRQLLSPSAGLLLLIAGAAQGVPVPATTPAPRPGAPAAPLRLVVTQRPRVLGATPAAQGSGAVLFGDFEGARLVLVESGRVVKVLSAGFASAADPEISYDGRRVLFAGQRQAGERWAIFEMKVDGSDVRLVTSGPDDLRQPAYLPTVHTIVADPNKGTEPREQLGYVGSSSTLRNEGGDAPLASLFSIKPDGSAPRRLTFTLGDELDPAVLPDGRVLYASWQRASVRQGVEGRVSLAGLNADGTDAALFAADEGRRVKRMPCFVRQGGLIVFVEGEQPLADGAGTLACVTLRRNLHSYRPITFEKDGLFRAPSPLADGRVVAAYRTADGRGGFGLVAVDPVSGRVTPLFDDPAQDELQAREVAPRPATDERSSAIKDPDEEARGTKEAKASHGPVSAVPDAKLYGLNVYLNDLGVDLAPGTITGLRIVEGLNSPASLAAPGPRAPRRLVGVAPVEADGSFQVQVPADTPLQVQILDRDGLSLSSSGWIWAQYKGQQGCVGCHEDAELTPPNRFVDAIAKPAASLLLAPEKRRSVDYQHDIAPLVAGRCTLCHAAGQTVDLSGPAAYATLGRYLDPGRARTSRLIWHLLGRNTARPWDGDRAAAPVKPLPPHAELTDDERRLFIEWVDLGALFDVTGVLTGGK